MNQEIQENQEKPEKPEKRKQKERILYHSRKETIVIFNTVADTTLTSAIISTSILPEIRYRFKKAKIYIISDYPEIYRHNPLVSGVFRSKDRDFFDKLIKKHNTVQERVVFLTDHPFHYRGYTANRIHITCSWLNKLNLYDSVTYRRYEPKAICLYLTIKEIANAREYLDSRGINKDLPTVVVDFTTERNIASIDYSLIQNNINKLKNVYNFIQINGNPVFDGCIQFNTGYIREVISILHLVDNVICSDNYMHHITQALGTPTTCIWTSTSPAIHGYSTQRNIYMSRCKTPQCGRPSPYLYDKNWICPNIQNGICPCGDYLPETIDKVFTNIEKKLVVI